jgi:ribosome-associated protein
MEGMAMDAAAPIRLDQYLKLLGWVRSGGEAKYLIQSGQVLVNGQVETHRSRKMAEGDRVSLAQREATVSLGGR